MDSYKLKDIQIEILKYLYRFRFLTSIQLSLILNQTIRYTNYHLKVLSSKHCIDKHYSRTLGMANQPAVYYLVSGSIGQLKKLEGVDKRALKRIYREKARSQQFIDHALFIAEYYLLLKKESEKTNHELHFFTKTDLLAHPYFIHPLPDAYFARIKGKEETKRYLVEVIDPSAPRFSLRRRIEQYSDYIESETFKNTTQHPFPTILFICPNVGVLMYLKKHIARIYEETSFDRTNVYFATQDGAFAGIWEKAGSEEE